MSADLNVRINALAADPKTAQLMEKLALELASPAKKPVVHRALPPAGDPIDIEPYGADES